MTTTTPDGVRAQDVEPAGHVGPFDAITMLGGLAVVAATARDRGHEVTMARADMYTGEAAVLLQLLPDYAAARDLLAGLGAEHLVIRPAVPAAGKPGRIEGCPTAMGGAKLLIWLAE